MRLGEGTYPKKRPTFIRRISQFMLFLLGMAALGFLAQFQWIGQIVIALYAVAALVRHIPARSTFMLALFTLGVVTPLGIMLSNLIVAQNFAAYSFILFLFGAGQIILEQRREVLCRSRNDNETA